MTLVILTTDTLHHARFVAGMVAEMTAPFVLVETTGVIPPFNTAHPFEDRRDAYERDLWFGGRETLVSDFANVSQHNNLNHPAAVAALKSLKPDVVVVFGTRRLEPQTIEACGGTVLNLHGGDPEYYRGLDSHLWAIYHGHWGRISTTLHRLTSKLDAGGIIHMMEVPLRRGMELYELQAANTENCISLTIRAIERVGSLAAPQRTIGRYYSFMPAVLKGGCVEKFRLHNA